MDHQVNTSSPPQLISVVIPNHNYAPYIRDAIGSVLSQDYQQRQVIVVDDASTDESRSILAAYADQVELVLLPSNRGQIQAYNAGFERVKGDIVIFLDSDDRLKPGALSAIAKAFKPGVSKVHWLADMIDRFGNRLGQQVPNLLVEGDMRTQMLKKGILYPSPPGSANAYCVQALRQLMPLPQHPQERHGADFFTIYGAGLVGAVVNAGEGKALSDYRLHTDSSKSLAFGNAAQGYSEHQRLQMRNEMFQDWIASRPSLGAVLERPLNEFSIEKNTFVRAIFDGPGYWPGFRAGVKRLPELMRCIAHRPGGLGSKAALLALCLGILALPRALGMPFARYLCNPTARSD